MWGGLAAALSLLALAGLVYYVKEEIQVQRHYQRRERRLMRLQEAERRAQIARALIKGEAEAWQKSQGK